MNAILLVEDDIAITESLKEFLGNEGFEVNSTNACLKAVEMLKVKRYSLVLLDIALSDGNGFRVSSIARELDIPVIFLTASSDENSVVRGFDMGADDYISKPFRPRELISRIKNVLRRHTTADSFVMLGNIIVDIDKARVFKLSEPSIKSDSDDMETMDKLCREELSLTALEYRILVTFINNRGRLLSREQLLEDIWDIAGDFVNDNTLTVYIKRLREKIEKDPQKPEIIQTVRGMGYRMD